MDAVKRKADTPRENTQSTESSDDDRDDFVDDPKLTEAGVQRRRDKDAKRRKENCCANMAEAQPAIRDAIRSLPAPAPEFAPKPKAGMVRATDDRKKWEVCIKRVMLDGVARPVFEDSAVALLDQMQADVQVITRAQFEAHERALEQLAGALPQKEGGHRDRSPLNDWSAVCADKLEAEGFRVADRRRPLVVAVLVDLRHGGGGGGGARSTWSWQLDLKVLYVPSAAFPRLATHHAPLMQQFARAVRVTDGRSECAHVCNIAPAPRSHQTAGTMAVCGWTVDPQGNPTIYGNSYDRDEHASHTMRDHAASMKKLERTFLAPALERRVQLAREVKMPPLFAWESRAEMPFTMVSLTAGFCCAPHQDQGEKGTLESILLAWPGDDVLTTATSSERKSATLSEGENWDFAAAGVICRVSAGPGAGGGSDAQRSACAAIFLPASGVYHYTLPLGHEGMHRLHPGLGSAAVSKPKILGGMRRHMKGAGPFASQPSQ